MITMFVVYSTMVEMNSQFVYIYSHLHLGAVYLIIYAGYWLYRWREFALDLTSRYSLLAELAGS